MKLGEGCQTVRFVFLAGLGCTALLAQKTEFTAKVTGIQEGDIIKVDYNGASKKIRLWGIDCPEMNQTFAPQAKKFTADLVLGKTVTVKVLEVDNFKRQVAFIVLPDGRNLNHELVKGGYAWWFVRYAKEDSTLEQLEAEARNNKRGLWAADNPTPPWEHRKHKRGPN